MGDLCRVEDAEPADVPTGPSDVVPTGPSDVVPTGPSNAVPAIPESAEGIGIGAALRASEERVAALAAEVRDARRARECGDWVHTTDLHVHTNPTTRHCNGTDT